MRMNVWRMYLSPHAKARENTFQFFLRHAIIGIGWPICDAPADTAPDDVIDYLLAMEQKYRALKDSGQWENSAAAIARDMRPGDLVWVREREDSCGRFYLGEVTGKWEYRNGGEYRKAGIVSVRACKLHEVRASDAGENADAFFQAFGENRFHFENTVQLVNDKYGWERRTIEIWANMQARIGQT